MQQAGMNAGKGHTRQVLVDVLRAMGVAPGDGLLVHSAYRSLGAVEGGPETVLDALLEALGPEGHLMLPTFNYTRPLPEPWYDPAETPGRTGIIPELGRRRPGAVRSLHPTHSVAVIGPGAARLTADHLACDAFGVDSPIDRLAREGGKVLLLGVAHTANSTVHVAEAHARIPKVSWYDPLPWVKVRLPDGRLADKQLDASPSCSAAFNMVEFGLRRAGAIRDAEIGACLLQLMTGAEVIRLTVALLRERPDSLLCAWPPCKTCAGTRALLRADGRLA